MTQSQTKSIQAVELAFDVLETLRRLDGAGVTQVARELDIPKSTAHSHLNTLHDREFVIKVEDEYRIGLRSLGFGAYSREQMEIYRVCKDNIDELAAQTGELSNLLVEEHGRGVYVYRSQGDMAVQLDTYAGKRVHLHSTALGKCILAEKPDEEVEEILDRHGLPESTEHTITDRRALYEELESIRDRGYAIDDEERLIGLRCLAAPIKINETIVGAMSVCGPTSRVKGSRLTEDIRETVTNQANVSGINLTYS